MTSTNKDIKTFPDKPEENKKNSNKEKSIKPWYKNPAYLSVIIATLAIIVAIIINLPSPDFSLSLTPMSGAVQVGGVIQTPIDVKSINGYDFTVSLSANGQTSGMVFTFGPPFGEAIPSYTSTITINVDQSVSPGIYKIGIKGTGADGKEHNCIYTLTVSPTSTRTPNGTPNGTIPTFNVRIISPNENGKVSNNIIVKGTVSRDLDDNEHLWIFVSDGGSNWWPQEYEIRPSKRTLEWSGPARIGGGEGDIGKNFRIAVIIVNDTLNYRISEWQKECKEKQDWPPITKYCVENYLIQENTFDEVTVILTEWIE